MSFSLEFGDDGSPSSYQVDLQSTNNDGLFISFESASFRKQQYLTKTFGQGGSVSSMESTLKEVDHIGPRQILQDLEVYGVYHFHDTSDTAGVKGTCDVDDNRYLRPQAENLAAFLYWMAKKKPDHFANVQDTLRQVAPFFGEFRLAPSKLNEAKIRLEWKEKGSDAYFNASSLSDGTLRFICLAALLLQPELPAVLLLDEPELGLHPAAITVLASLLSSAATRTQVIVATQSVTLVNQFEPNEVWTVDREEEQSVFRHLSKADMAAWLDEYGLGDLWEKNILGARP